MAVVRFCCLCVLSVALALTINQAGRTQPVPFASAYEYRVQVASKPSDSGMTCKTYALGELADDAHFCKWIADTIPEMIQPGSWTQGAKVSCYAPARVMVICQTPAVHAKVEEFLQGLKKTASQTTTKKSNEPAVLQAQFVPETGGVPTQRSGYPVAAPMQQPKHLFHFIIRYEGDGIVDSNVVSFAKAQRRERRSSCCLRRSRLQCRRRKLGMRQRVCRR